jgi:hypothetical protein
MAMRNKIPQADGHDNLKKGGGERADETRNLLRVGLDPLVGGRVSHGNYFCSNFTFKLSGLNACSIFSHSSYVMTTSTGLFSSFSTIFLWIVMLMPETPKLCKCGIAAYT